MPTLDPMSPRLIPPWGSLLPTGDELSRRSAFKLAMGAAGLAAELYLMEHYDSWTQIVPFAVLGCGLAVGVSLAYRPTRRMVWVFQAVMC